MVVARTEGQGGPPARGTHSQVGAGYRPGGGFHRSGPLPTVLTRALTRRQRSRAEWGRNVMTEETRPARRPGRRAPEIRSRTGAGRPASGGSAAPGTASHGAGAPAAAELGETGAWTPGPVAGLAVEVAERRPGTAVVTVTGEIDLHPADGLRARLVKAHAAGARRLVLDFAAVPFCDAAGLGALVGAHNEISASGG